jgi:hypothetical protein
MAAQPVTAIRSDHLLVSMLRQCFKEKVHKTTGNQ